MYLCMYLVLLVGSHIYYMYFIITCGTWILQIQLTSPHQFVILPVEWKHEIRLLFESRSFLPLILFCKQLMLP